MSKQRKSTWKEIRSGITGAADTALADATKNWASIYANHYDNLFKVDVLDTRVDFRFRFTNAGATANYTIYAFRGDDINNHPDAQFVCNGVATGGNMEADATFQIISGESTYYADKITITNDAWAAGVESSCEDDTIDDEMAELCLKTRGRKWFLVIVDTVSAGTVEVDGSAYDE
ncbi:MAG: hypothetical protein ACYTEQ_21850 [Planctomycetota bacterium]|jgi:hypothetical protein